MTDRNLSTTGRDAASLNESEWEARHQLLRDLLAAYGDRELPPETIAQVDAHLVGCRQCRRELAVHDAVRSRLAAEPPAAPSPALRARISTALDASVERMVGGERPASAASPDARDGAGGMVSRRAHLRVVAAAVTGWVLATVLLTAGGLPRWGGESAVGSRTLAAPVQSVPMLESILENYRRTMAGNLPGRARDLSAVRAAVSFPVEPLRAASLRLIAAWTSELDGNPVAVLAYRINDRVVLQYLVADDVFFRHPAVRSAIDARHVLTAIDGAQALIAWPSPAAGSLVIGDVPASALAGIWAAERAR